MAHDKPEQNEKDSGNLLTKGLPIGLPLGIAVGVSLGVALDNIAVGVALGVGIGMSFSVAIGAGRLADEKKRKNEDSGEA